MKWLPIEIAPKDCRLILWFPCYKTAKIGWWNKADEAWEEECYFESENYISPTHWMPLPEPPK